MRRPLRSCSVLLTVGFITSCGGDGSGVTDPAGPGDPPAAPSPAIGVAASPSSVGVPVGGTGSVSVTVTRSGGYTGSVSLSLEGAPEGVAGGFEPATLPAGTTSSTLTLTVGSSASPGSASLVVRAQGNGVDDVTTGLTLTVEEEAAYTVVLDRATASLPPGGSVEVAVELERTNFSGSVELSVSGAPDRVSASVSPPSTTGNSATLAVAVAADAQPGTSTLTVTGQADGLENRTATLQLTITQAGSLSLSVTPESVTIQRGQSVDVTVGVGRPDGFDGPVGLSLEGTPTGMSGAFAPATIPAGTAQSTLTIQVAADAALGTSAVLVRGQGDGVEDGTGALEVTVEAAPGYALALDPTSVSLSPGGEEEVALAIQRTNFSGSVTLSVSGAPDGVTASVSPASTTGNSATLAVAVAAHAQPGTSTLTVTGQADGLEDRTVTLQLTIASVGGFDLALSPSSVSMGQGSSRQVAVEITRTGGFDGPVSLAVTGAPSGLSASVDPAVTTGNSATVTLEAAGSLAAGVYTLAVQGSAEVGDGQTQVESATLTVTVTAVEGDCPGALTNGENHACAITVPEELHEWTFAATAGDYVALSMSRESGDIQPWIRLISPTGELLDGLRGQEVAQISLNAPASGTYTVIAGSRTAHGDVTGTGHYLLTLARAPGEFVVPEGDEGGPLTNGDNHPGFIHLGDLDMWTFSAVQGDYIALSMSWVDGDLSPWIRLISPTGELLDGHRAHEVAQINLNAPVSGTYTVIVGSRRPGPTIILNETGHYLLTLAQVPGAFVVPEGDDGGPLVPGADHFGFIHLGDLDMWTFTAAAGTPITVTMTRLEPLDGELRPWIRLVSPTGELVAGHRGMEQAQISMDVPMTGTYTVIAGSRRPGGTIILTGTGDYLLRLVLP